MDKTTYKSLLTEAATHLSTGNLLVALNALEPIARMEGDWEVTARLNNIQRAYAALLSYFRSGANDSGRYNMFEKFLRQADELYNLLLRRYLLGYTETAYAHAYRVLAHMESCPALSDLLTQPTQHASVLFDSVWTAEPFTESIASLFRSFFDNEDIATDAKQIVASALTLSTLEVFDALKFRLLISVSRHTDTLVRSRAMVGVVLVMLTHRYRIARYPELITALEMTYSTAASQRELVELQMQLLLSLETKEIARSLNQDILPEMLKKTNGKIPQTEEEISRLNAEMAELGLNPDWQRDAKHSEIGKKIHRLIEMQQKGADVYLSSFSMLKRRFSFFRQASNWFLPFSPDSPELSLSGTKRDFAVKLTKLGMFCESDKYSLALLLGQMPETQFVMLQNQLSSMLPDDTDIADINNTFTSALRVALQDFYRFATLFQHGDKRLNPFNSDMLLTTIEPFNILLSQPENLQQIAMFAFYEKNYAVALPIVVQLLSQEPTARLWQVAGYCHQRQGRFAEAVAAYERSGLFGEQSQWTIRQLAACNRAIGNYDKALFYYEQLSDEKDDDIPTLVRRAECLRETNRRESALELLHKASYLEETPGEGTRALLATLLSAGNFASALSVGKRLLAAEPTNYDRLLVAHATWLSGDTAEAVALYKGYYNRLDPTVRANQQTIDLLFEHDKDLLLQNGKTQLDLQIMADATAENQN